MSSVEVASATDNKCLEEASTHVEIVGNASSPRADAETKDLHWEGDLKKSPSDDDSEEHAPAVPAKNPWAKLKSGDEGKIAHVLVFCIILYRLNYLQMK